MGYLINMAKEETKRGDYKVKEDDVIKMIVFLKAEKIKDIKPEK